MHTNEWKYVPSARNTLLVTAYIIVAHAYMLTRGDLKCHGQAWTRAWRVRQPQLLPVHACLVVSLDITGSRTTKDSPVTYRLLHTWHTRLPVAHAIIVFLSVTYIQTLSEMRCRNSCLTLRRTLHNHVTKRNYWILTLHKNCAGASQSASVRHAPNLITQLVNFRWTKMVARSSHECVINVPLVFQIQINCFHISRSNFQL